MTVEIRTDLSLARVLSALDAKERDIRHGSRAKAKSAVNRARAAWEDYSGTYGRALDILALAEAQESQADADRAQAQADIEAARELTDESDRAAALSAAEQDRTDARRRSVAASEVATALRAKLGDDVMTTFEEFEAKLWLAVDAEDARLAELEDIRRAALIAGDDITADDAQRWYDLVGGLPVLLESTRQREIRRAKGIKGAAPKITASELDDLAELLG